LILQLSGKTYPWDHTRTRNRKQTNPASVGEKTMRGQTTYNTETRAPSGCLAVKHLAAFQGGQTQQKPAHRGLRLKNLVNSLLILIYSSAKKTKRDLTEPKTSDTRPEDLRRSERAGYPEEEGTMPACLEPTGEGADHS